LAFKGLIPSGKANVVTGDLKHVTYILFSVIQQPYMSKLPLYHFALMGDVSYHISKVNNILYYVLNTWYKKKMVLIPQIDIFPAVKLLPLLNYMNFIHKAPLYPTT